jgi:transcriptional antiterminator RfaH
MNDRCTQPESLTVPANGHSTAAWFCLRSHPKHEHLAARHLRQMEDVKVFNPRMRYTRSTRNGPVVVTESMFPNYLFAHFDWKTSLNRVHYAPGVNGVVHFGDKWPTVPEAAIEEIRALLDAEGAHVISNELQAGDTVEMSGGIFHGLNAIITRTMPGSQRVTVLMDFLGQQTSVEVGVESIIRRTIRRR